MENQFPGTCSACGNIIGLCTCHPPLFRVAQILAEKGHNAAYEYPGYVGITMADGRVANFGNANVDYGADWLESDDPIEFFMPETATVDELVVAIEGWITRQHLTPSAQQIFDNVVGAMQDAEEIWGPGEENYVPLMEAIIAECNQRIATYRANHGGVQ